MSSRRKSTTPCMVPPREEPAPHFDQEMENVVMDEEAEDDKEVVEEDDCGVTRVSADHELNATEGGYECKYCSFRTAELNLFTVHVSTEHPDVVITTSYVCMECDYHTKR